MKNYLLLFFLFCSYISSGQTFNDYANAGLNAEGQHNYQQALIFYLKAQELDPKNAVISQKIGLIYFYYNKFDSAIFFYTDALNDNPKDTFSYLQRGGCYLNTGDYQKALDDYVSYSKLSKTMSPGTQYYIGKCDEGLGKWDDAISRFNKVLVARPGDKYTLYEIAYCYTLTFDKFNAMKYYNKAIDQDPNYYDAYLNRGLLFESQFNNFTNALQDLEKSIQIKPNNKLSYLYEGELYNQEHKYNEAKDVYDKVIAMYPDFGEGYFERAIAWQGLGNINMVCEDLNTAEKLGYKKATEYKKDVCK